MTACFGPLGVITPSHRRRIMTEEKSKVVAVGGRTKFIIFQYPHPTKMDALPKTVVQILLLLLNG